MATLSTQSQSTSSNQTNTSNSTQAIIDSIVCPISGMPMHEPVTGTDGQTYEKSEITKWLAKHAISPMTRQPMTIDDLQVNANIRYLCDKYHAGEFGTIPKQKSKVLDSVGYTIQSDAKVCLVDSIHHFSFGVEKDSDFTLDSLPGVDLYIVEDCSASTGAETSTQDENGKTLEVGFSINDVINHAAKTVASSLRPKDRLGIIAFDDRIDHITTLTSMTPVNKAGVIGKIDDIKPRGSTNIYGGVIAALDEINKRDDKTRQAAIIALTDGQPNVCPARGEVGELRELRKNTNFSTPIYMMGFGYHLQRGLLYQMSKEGNASTGHIPDGGMVGTVFSNFLANIMCSACSNLQLHITSLQKDFDMEKCQILGDFTTNYSETEPHKITINVGSVQFEQSRDIMVKDLPEYYRYHFSCKMGGKVYTSSEQVVNVSDSDRSIETTNKNYSYNKLRLLTCDELRRACQLKKRNEDTNELYRDLVAIIDKNTDSKSKSLAATIKDQVYMILGSDKREHMTYYNKWGEFYLDQLTSTLLRQFSPNFKDEACMVFNNPCFDMVVKHVADTFNTLPPPTPSIKKYDQNTGSYRSLGVATMATFNSQDNGCWTGDSKILMGDGLYRNASEVKPGDSIVSFKDHNDPRSRTLTKVKTVVVTTQENPLVKLVTLPGGAKLTAWHPFMNINDQWSFPVEQYRSNVSTYNCSKLYNLVLEDYHVVVVNGMPCITLGHGYTDGILAHPYFGTDAIIRDLEKCPDYHKGIVSLNTSQFSREGPKLHEGDISTVNGMNQKPTFQEQSFGI